MNPAATTDFKLLGIVELNMPETSTRELRRSIMLHPPPSFSCHVERTRLPRSSFMQRRETALISLPINFRSHELVCRLRGGLGRASPYQQRPRSRIGRARLCRTGGSADLIIQTSVRCQRSSRSVIPTPNSFEGCGTAYAHCRPNQ